MYSCQLSERQETITQLYKWVDTEEQVSDWGLTYPDNSDAATSHHSRMSLNAGLQVSFFLIWLKTCT